MEGQPRGGWKELSLCGTEEDATEWRAFGENESVELGVQKQQAWRGVGGSVGRDKAMNSAALLQPLL